MVSVDNQRELSSSFPLNINRSLEMARERSEILQGTLDLMILQSLQSMGALHGWGIARRIEQVSDDVLFLNQGTIYPALVRLEQRGWIRSKWGVSENNRKAKFFEITKSGQRQLAEEAADWRRTVGIISRLLDSEK
jgi:PadR family transcriptional regulator, regulatory protein PadR